MHFLLTHSQHFLSSTAFSWSNCEHSVSSVAQLCLTLCDRMDCSRPGLPVQHQLPEFTQTHVHWVDDTFKLSHLLSSPSPPALSLSQQQGLFKWVSSLNQVTKSIWVSASKHQSFQWTLKTDLLWNGLVGSPYSPTLTSIHDHWQYHSFD